MSLSIFTAWPDEASEPPKPPPPVSPKPASAAFQRRLAEQRAAAQHARNAHEPAPTRPPAKPTRPPQPAASAGNGVAKRQGSEREATPLAQQERPNEGAVTAFSGLGQGGSSAGNSNSGGGGQGSLAGSGLLPAQALQEELDYAALLDLLPADGESGIFELLLPGGERLAVMADITPRQACFLLTPSGERLRHRLRQRKMELEKDLAQRMDRHVRLTVL